MKKFLPLFLPSFTLLLSLALCLYTPQYAAAENLVQVHTIIDGDTIIANGEKIRLLGINAPEKAYNNKPAELGATQAINALKRLLKPKGIWAKVRLEYDTHKKDQYGRTLAHLYLADGTWVNKKLLEEGVVHVYSFPDNRSHLNALLKAEATARTQQKGLWAHPRWQTLKAHTLKPDTRIGAFHLVHGTPRYMAKIKNKIYLNYGEDWRTDFSVEIPKKFWPLFKKEGQTIKTYLETHIINKPVTVRGRLKPVNGVLITVTHPEQFMPLSE